MSLHMFRLRLKYWSNACQYLSLLLLLAGLATSAQEAAPAPIEHTQKVKHVAASVTGQSNDGAGISEEELKTMLVGKPLFLRSGYLSDSLSFNLNGELIGNSERAPFTLCAVKFDKVRLTRRKVELAGARYGLHFLGALAYEDSSKAVDLVKITPKKKSLKITIDRELVVKPKKVKKPKANKKHPEHAEDTEQVQAENAATQDENLPADSGDATTTTSPAHSAMVLRAALSNIFADSIDERMIAAMPDFWKFYYQAAETKTDFRPADPAVMRQNTVDQKAKLISRFEPESNEFAQDHGVAGMSLYHVVVGTDGKADEIAVARPIGFGLDENAVAAIRSAKFEPAIKDGKPVPVLLDLVVQFRIYSKRTAVIRPEPASDKPTEPALPGPYSVQHP